jgi:hypothetical protein
LDDNLDVNRAWGNIRDNIKISAQESLGHYELKQHKPWFNEECSKLLDRRKQAKFQWLKNPRQTNGDNMDNKRSELSRIFRTKKREYPNKKTIRLKEAVIIKILRDLYRGINEVKKGNQSRTNLVNDENGNLLANSQST